MCQTRTHLAALLVLVFFLSVLTSGMISRQPPPPPPPRRSVDLRTQAPLRVQQPRTAAASLGAIGPSHTSPSPSPSPGRLGTDIGTTIPLTVTGGTSTDSQLQYLRPTLTLSSVAAATAAAAAAAVVVVSPMDAHAAIAATASSASDSTPLNVFFDTYWRYFLSGSICCSLSHGITVPIDVLKTKKQVRTELAEMSILNGFKLIVEEDGLGVLFKGLSPTLIGYAIQGSLKYGFYEVFKPLSKVFLSDHGIEGNQLLQFALASIAAETIGATILAPTEAARIRMVTIEGYSNSLGGALRRMVNSEGVGSLFQSLPVIFTKSLPYTAVQLTSFEFISSSLYSQLLENGISDLGPYRIYVTLLSSFVAAGLSTVASQPGDTLLTILNKESAKMIKPTAASTASSKVVPALATAPSNDVWKNFFVKVKELPPAAFFAGIEARILHVGVIVVCQLLIYDYVKQLCGVPLVH